jgi:hypothetical protein
VVERLSSNYEALSPVHCTASLGSRPGCGDLVISHERDFVWRELENIQAPSFPAFC